MLLNCGALPSDANKNTKAVYQNVHEEISVCGLPIRWKTNHSFSEAICLNRCGCCFIAQARSFNPWNSAPNWMRTLIYCASNKFESLKYHSKLTWCIELCCLALMPKYNYTQALVWQNVLSPCRAERVFKYDETFIPTYWMVEFFTVDWSAATHGSGY